MIFFGIPGGDVATEVPLEAAFFFIWLSHSLLLIIFEEAFSCGAACIEELGKGLIIRYTLNFSISLGDVEPNVHGVWSNLVYLTK